MVSFLGNKAKESMNITDEVIAKNMLSSATGAANAYLNASMTSTTPEVRAAFSSSLNQILNGHSALTDLTVKREWGNPYIAPSDQLSVVYNKTQSIMQETKQ
jgi:spore coat protein CotF